MTKKTKRARPGFDRERTKEQKRVLELVTRLCKQHTMEEIARASGVSLATISRYARGEATPYRNAAERLVASLETLASA